MKNTWSLLTLLLGFFLPAHRGAQAGVTLLVTTDMSCKWTLDGHAMGELMPDSSKVVPVAAGEHLIEAATSDGVAVIRTRVLVDQGQNTLALQLKREYKEQLQMRLAEKPKAPVCADSGSPVTWTDPATGLMWTRKDNGSDINWNQAGAYCSKLALAGYGDWRLPSLEELQGIYDPSLSCRKLFDNSVTYALHVKGNLILTGWTWSSSEGTHPGHPWTFVFDRAQPQDGFNKTFTYSMRALCVRSSGA